jgi:hypothetical protein
LVAVLVGDFGGNLTGDWAGDLADLYDFGGELDNMAADSSNLMVSNLEDDLDDLEDDLEGLEDDLEGLEGLEGLKDVEDVEDVHFFVGFTTLGDFFFLVTVVDVFSCLILIASRFLPFLGVATPLAARVVTVMLLLLFYWF